MAASPAAPFDPPVLLTAEHSLAGFACSEPILDDWLRRRALANQLAGASRTYEVVAQQKVIAYYSLATGALARSSATGAVRRNMPEPIPVMLLGRLAVDQTWQGRGLGAALVRDAILRTLQAANIAGIRALLVHALNDRAAAFYAKRGFRPSPVDRRLLMITLAEAAAELVGP